MTGSSQSQRHSIQGIDVSWEHTRELFSFDPAVTYLNHGSFGAVPVPVQRAQQRLRDEMEANPMAFFTRGIEDRLAHTRRHIAAFLGADAECTTLIPNATAGMALALGTLDLAPGDEILLTDHGYGAVRLAVDRLCARTGATVSTAVIPLRATDDEIVRMLTDAVRSGRTRFAVIDHITSPTARVLPVVSIVAALHEQGVVVAIDGAHVPGMLPVRVSSLGADFWFGNLHKWAFAPRPTAVLVVAPSQRARVEPLVVSWDQPSGFPAAVEYGGTLDYTAWLAAPTGIHLLRTLDPARVRRHNADLAGYGQRKIAEALGVAEADLVGSDAVSMRIIPLPGQIADVAAARALRGQIAAELGTEVAIACWHDRAYLRVSAQIYNRTDDYDRLASALPNLLRRPGTERGHAAV